LKIISSGMVENLVTYIVRRRGRVGASYSIVIIVKLRIFSLSRAAAAVFGKGTEAGVGTVVGEGVVVDVDAREVETGGG
jgi:hypothetical protein